MTPEAKRTKERAYYAQTADTQRARKSAAMRRYRAENPEKHRAQSRAAKQRLRAGLFQMYGRTCALCGFDDARALTLDHLLNNGAQERAAIGERGVYRRALQLEHRHEYRMLCMNCQFIARCEAHRQNQHGGHQ